MAVDVGAEGFRVTARGGADPHRNPPKSDPAGSGRVEGEKSLPEYSARVFNRVRPDANYAVITQQYAQNCSDVGVKFSDDFGGGGLTFDLPDYY